MTEQNKDNDFFTIFVFPFKYETVSGDDPNPDLIAQKLHKNNNEPEKGWAKKEYNIDCEEKYNEYYYFHPFVREALFNKKGNVGMEYLTRTDYKCMEVEFLDQQNKTRRLIVDVKSADLHLFDNQIGILTITIEKRPNDTGISYQDFLRFNDIARRVYPPYLDKFNRTDNTSAPKQISKLLPLKTILLHATDEAANLTEEFSHIDLKINLGKDVVFLSKIITGLLSDLTLLDDTGKVLESGEIYYTPFVDDRMFIISYFSDGDLSGRLCRKCCGEYAYEGNDSDSAAWYSFVFVDGSGPGIANNTMMKELIKKSTYGRWADNKTLFGMSRYSFVMLCGDGWDHRNIFKYHMKSIYYQLALIMLFQRAMLLKFSEDIDEVTKGFKVGSISEALRKRAEKLQGDFIKFVNKYWFVEVTPQEQGLEIYSQWVNLVGLEKLFSEVQREISDLGEYVEAKIEFETNKRVAALTILGLPLVVVTAIISLWQVYNDSIKNVPNLLKLFAGAFSSNSFRFLFIISVVSGTIVLICLIVYFNWKIILSWLKRFFVRLKS